MTSVDSDIKLASPGLRILARVVDGVIVGAVGVGVRAALPFSTTVEEAALLVVALVYEVLLIAFRGQTLGKAFLDIRVTDPVTRRPIGLIRSMLRVIGIVGVPIAMRWGLRGPDPIGPITQALGLGWSLILLLSIGLSKSRQGLHDRLPGSVVIDTRSSTRLAHHATPGSA